MIFTYIWLEFTEMIKVCAAPCETYDIVYIGEIRKHNYGFYGYGYGYGYRNNL